MQNIHDQLDALDPATRAAVVARLTSEEVERVHDLRSLTEVVDPLTSEEVERVHDLRQ